jgi:hypothetical protein
MPIRRAEYPPDWEAISNYIRFERAQGRCEKCGVAHGRRGVRDANGRFIPEEDLAALTPELIPGAKPPASRALITIILTVSHFDRDTTNNSDWNLFAYCQACHLAHDRQDNWRRRRRRAQAQADRAGQRALGLRSIE